MKYLIIIILVLSTNITQAGPKSIVLTTEDVYLCYHNDQYYGEALYDNVCPTPPEHGSPIYIFDRRKAIPFPADIGDTTPIHTKEGHPDCIIKREPMDF